MDTANIIKSEYPPYILRKSDFSILIFENGTYHFKVNAGQISSSNQYSLETLRDTYNGTFSPIYSKEEAKEVEELSRKYYHSFVSVTNKNDGHGGSYSEFSGNFIDYLKHKGISYVPSEFTWSDEKIYSKNDIEELKNQILKNKEIVLRQLSIVSADDVMNIINDFLKK